MTEQTPKEVLEQAREAHKQALRKSADKEKHLEKMHTELSELEVDDPDREKLLARIEKANEKQVELDTALDVATDALSEAEEAFEAADPAALASAASDDAAASSSPASPFLPGAGQKVRYRMFLQTGTAEVEATVVRVQDKETRTLELAVTIDGELRNHTGIGPAKSEADAPAWF